MPNQLIISNVIKLCNFNKTYYVSLNIINSIISLILYYFITLYIYIYIYYSSSKGYSA